MKTCKPYRLKKKGNYWYYKTETMKSFWTTGERTKTKAEQVVIGLIKSNKAGKTKYSFKEYSEPYFIWDRCPHATRLRAEGKRIGEGYCKAQRRVLERYVFPSGLANKAIGDITRGDILDFRNGLVKNGVSGNMIDRTMKAIKVILGEAEYRQDIPFNPASKISKSSTKENKEAAIFTLEQLQALFSNPDKTKAWKMPADYICFLIASCTGMRRGEILALRWGNVHLDRQYIHIKDAWKDGWTHIGDTKSGKERDVVMPAILVECLRRYYQTTPYNKPEDFVVCKEDGTAYSQQRWYKAFNRALEAVGIPKPKDKHLKPHSFRHTLNTLLRNSGENPMIIRDMLGWADEGIQNHYTHNDIPSLSANGLIADVISPAITVNELG